MKKWGDLKPVRLVESELKVDLGKDNFIFVGSSTDIFADDVPEEWIIKVIDKCRLHDNKYLFQSKNPERMYKIFSNIPIFKNVVFGTTIESDITHYISDTPSPEERAYWIEKLKELGEVMITIEPIMEFEDDLIKWVRDIKPKWVNIGADSQSHKLPEPSKEKILELIDELKKVTEVKQKNNLGRLLK